jgi:hypothetical protein
MNKFRFMRICIHICIYIYVYTYILYIYICTYMYVCVYLHVVNVEGEDREEKWEGESGGETAPEIKGV